MKLLLYILFSFTSITIFAQGADKTALTNERENIKKELAVLEAEYKTILNSKEKSLTSLRIIQDKISVQNRLINNIGNELNIIDRSLTGTQKDIKLLNSKLDTLKKAYARSIVYAYKNKNSYDFLTFIFSANSFNDAYRRVQYLKEYRNYRARQTEEIIKYKNFLLKKTNVLDEQKKEKSDVLQNQSSALGALAGDQNSLSNTVSKITANQNVLANAIAKARNRQSKISSQIVAIARKEDLERKKIRAAERKKEKEAADAIARAEAKARADAAKAGKPTTSKPTAKVPTPKAAPKPKQTVEEIEYTQAEVNANASFEQNKGRMNYPLQGGYIRTRFGVQDLGGVKWNNESTTFGSNAAGANVTAIFSGVVKNVQIDDDTKTVFISHGRYISVYGNMQSVSITTGQTITAGQVIGKCAASEEEAGQGLLELMIFRDTKIENPERWLHR